MANGGGPPATGANRGDLLAGAALALGAALAYASLPDGSILRVALVAPVLLVVPGYLLLQAVVVPRTTGRARLVHALAALGISPAVVGLLALSTALVPGGFRPASMVTAVTGACLVLAVVASRRRSEAARRAGDAAHQRTADGPAASRRRAFQEPARAQAPGPADPRPAGRPSEDDAAGPAPSPSPVPAAAPPEPPPAPSSRSTGDP